MASIPPSGNTGLFGFIAPTGSNTIPLSPCSINPPEIQIIKAKQRTAKNVGGTSRTSADDDIQVATKHINQLINQIKYTTNCDNLQKVINRNLNTVKSQIAHASKHELSIIEQYLPVIHLPSPNPVSIVKWLGKLVLGPIYPQVEAQIKYVVELAQLAVAVTNLAIVIEQVAPRLEACAISELNEIQSEINCLKNLATNTITAPISALNNAVLTTVNQLQQQAVSQVTGALGTNNPISNGIVSRINGVANSVDTTTGSMAQSIINDISTTVNNAVQPALARVAQMQTQIANVMGPTASQGYPIYDTSNPQNFLASAASIGTSHSDFVQNYISNVSVSSTPFNAGVVAGNNTLSGYSFSSNSSSYIGQTLIAADSSIPANTIVTTINTVTGSVVVQPPTVGTSILTMPTIDPNIVIGSILSSSDPAFVNGTTVTNVANNLIAISTPYLGPNTSFTINYVSNFIIMSNNATSSNTSASITFNQVPIPVAGT
jgi:hypothetical protein